MRTASDQGSAPAATQAAGEAGGGGPIEALGRRAKAASRQLALASTAVKDAALLAGADALVRRG